MSRIEASSREVPGLFAGYRPSANCEAFSAPGLVREHWQKLIEGLDRIGGPELDRRMEQARRKFGEHGVTYNLFGDPDGLERPWELDLLPFVISAAEWDWIERACIQRTRLLNALLADLHGPRSLLGEGALPPEFVFANPGFLRPCHGAAPPENRFLFFHSLDIYRDGGGTWRVLGDYARNPIGHGFALENRIVLSHVLPRVYRDNQVRRLAPFFLGLRDELARTAPRHGDDPRIVILSSGPGSRNYFEHAFLSRYLTFTLVESGDLTVRDNRLFLKTLRSLEPVDVIFRCLADTDCDPLIFSGEPTLGVPGLHHAARSGRVALVNALGAGMIEAPALFPYLPELCRRLLGEELLLPSPNVWWCGHGESLRHVLENFDRLGIMPAFRGEKDAPMTGGNMPAAGDLRAAVKARPHLYAAFEPFATSVCPSWTEQGVDARHAILRLFVAASGEGYAVLPGGLCRVARDMDVLLARGKKTAVSKDIWVLSDTPVAPVSLMSNLQRIGDIHRGSDLPSRVADNLLWLGRYLERLEGAHRLLRSVVWRLDDEREMEESPEVRTLLTVLEELGLLAEEAAGEKERGSVEFSSPADFVRIVLVGPDGRGPMKELIRQAHRTAASVRDRLSWDAWRVLGGIEKSCEKARDAESLEWADVETCLNETIISLCAFSGLVMESTTRGQGWRFMDMGRRLERAGFITALVRNSLVTPHDPEEKIMEAVLEVLDSSMTYRARYRTFMQITPVLDLLLLDESNPRSLAFQLATLASHVEHLPRESKRPFSTGEERLSLDMLTASRLADLDGLHSLDAEGSRRHLGMFLENMERGLRDFGRIITQHYLSRVPTTQHFNILFPEARR